MTSWGQWMNENWMIRARSPSPYRRRLVSRMWINHRTVWMKRVEGGVWRESEKHKWNRRVVLFLCILKRIYVGNAAQKVLAHAKSLCFVKTQTKCCIYKYMHARESPTRKVDTRYALEQRKYYYFHVPSRKRTETADTLPVFGSAFYDVLRVCCASVCCRL